MLVKLEVEHLLAGYVAVECKSADTLGTHVEVQTAFLAIQCDVRDSLTASGEQGLEGILPDTRGVEYGRRECANGSNRQDGKLNAAACLAEHVDAILRLVRTVAASVVFTKRDGEGRSGWQQTVKEVDWKIAAYPAITEDTPLQLIDLLRFGTEGSIFAIQRLGREHNREAETHADRDDDGQVRRLRQVEVATLARYRVLG